MAIASKSALARARRCFRIEGDALAATARGLDRRFIATARAVEATVVAGGKLIFSGVGKSAHIAQKIAATFNSTGVSSYFLDSTQALHGDLGRVRAGDVAVLLSYSGGTEELVNLAAILRTDGIRRVGISCNHGTHLARLSDVHLAIGDVVEACPLNLAPTASTTAMLAMGDALALAVSRRRNFAADDFRRRHPGGALGAGLRGVTEVIRFRVGESAATVPERATVAEALRAAGGGRRAGALLVVDANGRLAGIFTDGDLRRHINESGADALGRPIRELMTARPSTLSADALVRDAVQLVRERRLDEIPVVDADGRPIGIVDVQDLVAMKVIEAAG